MKVAFSHDWLNGMRGGEKCLAALCELYPASPIFTLFYEKGGIREPILSHPVHASALQNLPAVFTHYRHYLPLFPRCIESFNTDGFDLIISTSHCVAKGIKKNGKTLHICYCLTPMRYAWGFFEEYFGRRNGLSKTLIQWLMRRLREWDLKTNCGVDHFVAISEHVKKRIHRFYNRQADVIYPPVDTRFFRMGPPTRRDDYYLIVSALVPYKRIELAVKAANRLGRKLVIIGDGPEKKFLKDSAGDSVSFLGRQPDEVLLDHYRRARALIFPGEEDFGIVPVEAQACGCPVIAYGRGGALETVEQGTTGCFFEDADEESLIEGILRFEKKEWDPQAARKNALRFDKSRFQSQIQDLIRRRLGQGNSKT